MRQLERRSEQWDRRQLITQSAAERRRSRVDVDLPIYTSAPHEAQNGGSPPAKASSSIAPAGFALPEFFFGAASPTGSPALGHQDSDGIDAHEHSYHGDHGRGNQANGVLPSPEKTDPHIPNAPASNQVSDTSATRRRGARDPARALRHRRWRARALTPTPDQSLQRRASASERVISTSTQDIRPALCIRILGIGARGGRGRVACVGGWPRYDGC